MDVPNLIGLSGAMIAGIAYIPQIIHLIKERCTAGISKYAFTLWLIAAVLVTLNAVYINSVVFIALGIIQILSTGIILLFSVIHKNNVCEFHATSVIVK